MLTRFVLILAILGTSLTFTKRTHAESWTDVTGKYKVEAEFVSMANGVVSLKKTDGRVIQVPVAKLDAASKFKAQKFASRTSKPDAAAKLANQKALAPQDSHQDLVDQVSVTVSQVTPREQKWYSRNKVVSKVEKLLKLDLQLSGQPALDACEYGFLKLDRTTGDGAPIERKKSVVFDMSERFKEIGGLQGAKKTDTHLSIPLEFNDLEETPKSVSIAGAIKLKTGGTKSTITLEDLKTGLVEMQEVKAAGLWMHVEIREGKELLARFDGETKNLEEFSFVDASGKKLKGVSSGSHHAPYQGRKVLLHHCELRDAIPTGAKIILKTRANPSEITVPFKLDNIPVHVSR